MERNLYFDFLRGIAIIMVVAIHTYTITNDVSTIALRQILNCAVPLFLAISGYFMASKDCSSSDKYTFFIKKQVTRVYLPCLLWSIPQFALLYYLGQMTVENAVFMFVGGYFGFYFITLIIQYYLLLPILQSRMSTKGLALSLVISLLSVAIITYLMQIKGISIPLVIYAGGFPLWLVFFYLGLYLRKCSEREYKVAHVIHLVLITFILQVIETRYLMTFNGGGVGIKPSSFLFSFCIILVAFSKKMENLFERCKRILYPVVKIGNFSFGIYLAHCYFIYLLGIYFPYDGYGTWVINTIIALLLSLATIVILRKIVNKRYWKIIGC